MTTSAAGVNMLPYRRQGDIDYSSLEFKPDLGERPPDHMEQSIPIQEFLWLIHAWLGDFYRRPDVFIDNGNFICYDRSNLNVRVAPDVYIALGVDAEAIRSRGLYLPWEVGKPPDWALEIASESTGHVDTGQKRRIYAQIGISEYWRFDPSGGDYHGQPLAGERLVDGIYQPIELTTEPDGVLKGYSELLRISLCWHDGRPRLYDPATGEYLRGASEGRELLRQSEADLQRSEVLLEQNETALEAERAETRRLRARLRRHESGG